MAPTSRTNVNTPDTVRRMAKPPMVMRSIRVPEDLWERLKARAVVEQKDVSQIVRELIERYLRT